jgi:hypothetical protein
VRAFLCFLALLSAAALEAADDPLPATPEEPSFEWCSSAKGNKNDVKKRQERSSGTVCRRYLVSTVPLARGGHKRPV